MQNKIIRYLTLAFGITFCIVPLFLNYESPSFLIEQIGFFLIVISPFFAFFFYSRKEIRMMHLLLPSLLLCLWYALILFSYIGSDSSTAALAFVIAPVFGFGILIFTYAALFLISKLKPKN